MPEDIRIEHPADRWTYVSNDKRYVCYIFNWIPEENKFAVHYGTNKNLLLTYNSEYRSNCLYNHCGIIITAVGELSAQIMAVELVSKQLTIRQARRDFSYPQE
jgi:hypothetical protein